MDSYSYMININRGIVMDDYNSATKKNEEAYRNGDVKASMKYIYDNQKEDAAKICNYFYTKQLRAISVVKRTKVGMNGLGIEIAKIMATHPDDNFVVHRNNIFFITAMSNKSWEDDMIEQMPTCFSKNVHHHGKLQGFKKKLKNIKNAIIIIDEIDTGDKVEQKLDIILKESGILDIKYMEENNIRFVFVSATMINELRDLYRWGDKHETCYMTIPDNYIGHMEFLELGIIKEYYAINSDETAEKWIREDILENYGSDYRVHIIRTEEKSKDYIFNACIRNKILFKNHTCSDKISYEELSGIFNNISNHVVIAIKGFYRRANLIPNEWKMKIGATHEKYVKQYDTNVQVQGLPGRMSGYWKQEILNGHKTGPHRTSIEAINEYEEFYKNPFGNAPYKTMGAKKLLVNPNNIKNLEIAIVAEVTNKRVPVIISGLDITDIIFTTTKRTDKIARVLSLLNNNEAYKRLYDFINNPDVVCAQITKPECDNSYKKHITDVVNASISNTPYIVDQKKENKGKNNWQLFIDNREKRLCIVIWSINEELY
jgi:hypothetical protein